MVIRGQSGGRTRGHTFHPNDGSLLYPQHDDVGNPGDVEWATTDESGYVFPIIKVQDLKGQPVISTGYFREPSNDMRDVIPYVEFAGGVHVCAMCSEGGAVICHTQGKEHDLLCQLRFPRT